MRLLISKSYGAKLLYVFMIGVVTGVILVNTDPFAWLQSGSLFADNSFSQLFGLNNGSNLSLFSEISGSELVWDLIAHRMKCVFFVMISSAMVGGVLLLYGFVAYFGIAFGCLMTIAVICYGFKGAFLVLMMLFPQGILIFPAFLFLVREALHVHRIIFLSWKNNIGTGKERNKELAKGLLWIVVIIIVVIIGCVVESYVNPKILHLFLKIFY